MPTEAEIQAAADAEKAAAEKTQKEDDDALAAVATEAGKKAILAEREARRVEAKARKAVETELATLKAEKAAADAAKAKADEAEALKRGEHEQVITAKTTENETLKAQLDSAAKRLAAIDAMSVKRIDDGLKANQVDEAFLAFDPGPDAPLDQRLDWFEKAVAASEGDKRNTFQRTPITPRPAITTKEQAQEREKQLLARQPQYRRF